MTTITSVLPPLKWSPSPNYYARGMHKVRLIVAHDCEGSYLGSIGWFGMKRSGVSAHFVLKEDGSEATQCVDLRDAAWHVKAFNREAIGLEMAGWAVKGFENAEWQAEANMTAYLLHVFGLPPKWAQGGNGRGFCRHYDLGRAGGGHADPTTDNAKWAEFEKMVQAAYQRGGFPAQWAHGEPAHAAMPLSQSVFADSGKPGAH